eukprot:TRINITY_DN777894_c0_g1_i1.p1 TRINITY_DN777894_c0_g1~~TRINITY_DN777894_c0_g1_i1.p1  ORF type:complete len:286 (+),score=88.98 TRINITY_DN777894_c0_g1_i1:84-941(+)
MPRVIVKNPKLVDEKRHAIVESGPENLSVVADFDFTISRFSTKDGKRVNGCHSVVENCGLLSEEYHKNIHKLLEKYYPLEISTEISFEEKLGYMEEWWHKSHTGMIKNGFRKEYVKKAVEVSVMELREHYEEIAHILEDNQIPLLVLSAGIADIATEILIQKNLLLENVDVVSNKMLFDDDGLLIGFNADTIHSLNKFLSSVPGNIKKKVDDRKNCILLGDNLADVNMQKGGLQENTLTIGFLNDRIEDRLEMYCDTFDVVVVGDGDMKYVLDLINEVVAQKPEE